MPTVIAKRREKLLPLVDIDTSKCTNCHACIHACPVKYCNNGVGDYIEIEHDLCIGCGACIRRCTHGARCHVDDLEAFIHHSLVAGKKTIAIVAPSAVVNFGEDHLRLNGWLTEACGVEAVFDASFGAELTVKSYAEHLKAHPSSCVIAQPCPSIVSFIELYLPDLIPNLAPIDSPMVHTMKMIREFHPEYADHQIVAITPCMSKKREFMATRQGDYNVSFRSIQDYLEANKIPLSSFDSVDFANPAPERAVMFSTPGGLLRALEREMPEVRDQTRTIEGPRVYDYLSSLAQAIEDGTAPRLIDCLNCDFGCNGGPLSNAPVRTRLDQVEDRLKMRCADMAMEDRKQADTETESDGSSHLQATLGRYWKKGLYERRYRDRSANNRLDIPTAEDLKQVYLTMGKRTERDLYDCDSCGYERCENMAIAIFNGMNKPENCHFHLVAAMTENDGRLRALFSSTSAGMCVVDQNLTILFVNDALCEMLSSTKERLLGTQLFKTQFETYLTKDRPILEFRIKRPEGLYTRCLFNASEFRHKTAVGEQLGYFAVVTDISQSKPMVANTMKLEDAVS